MEAEDKRGVLLVDEMKLSESITFDEQTMKFAGLVNLSQHTPNNLKNVAGDHALVFMYVPFRGRWVQSIACFISKNYVTSAILHKLLIECIILLENSGFNVDVVTMDGAQNDRGVWRLMNITETSVFCEHPYDASRQLFFNSDPIQDSLERLFSVMRSSCGSNDHPDPKLFGQAFRLVSCLSLVKPREGCNVDGFEILDTLMGTKEMKMPRKKWIENIDRILEDRPVSDEFSAAVIQADYQLPNHSYAIAETRDNVLAYVTGYLLRKMTKNLQCQNCILTLAASEEEKNNKIYDLIKSLDLYDGLQFPSERLLNLCRCLESAVLEVAQTNDIACDTMEAIMQKFSEIQFEKLGCPNHSQETTLRIIDVYTILRGNLLAKWYYRSNEEGNKKTKQHRKIAKFY